VARLSELRDPPPNTRPGPKALDVIIAPSPSPSLSPSPSSPPESPPPLRMLNKLKHKLPQLRPFPVAVVPPPLRGGRQAAQHAQREGLVDRLGGGVEDVLFGGGVMCLGKGGWGG